MKWTFLVWPPSVSGCVSVSHKDHRNVSVSGTTWCVKEWGNQTAETPCSNVRIPVFDEWNQCFVGSIRNLNVFRCVMSDGVCEWTAVSSMIPVPLTSDLYLSTAVLPALQLCVAVWVRSFKNVNFLIFFSLCFISLLLLCEDKLGSVALLFWKDGWSLITWNIFQETSWKICGFWIVNWKSLFFQTSNGWIKSNKLLII